MCQSRAHPSGGHERRASLRAQDATPDSGACMSFPYGNARQCNLLLPWTLPPDLLNQNVHFKAEPSRQVQHPKQDAKPVQNRRLASSAVGIENDEDASAVDNQYIAISTSRTLTIGVPRDAI
jgi:hypothetical protein